MQKTKSKNKFTLRIILSYAILGALVFIASTFILSEFKIFLAEDTGNAHDRKLLKTSTLLTQLYEAESLSKLALQNTTKENFKAYTEKIKELSEEIDTLKLLIGIDYQKQLLDSVQQLLLQKMANSEELQGMKRSNQTNSSLDAALEKFNSMELSLGKITAQAIVPNLDELSPEAQRAIEKLVVVLNNNVPKEGKEAYSSEKIDSMINASKELLNEAKKKEAALQRSLAKTELEIYKNDLNLSEQLRRMIYAFEQEVITSTFMVNQEKQAVLTKSTQLAAIAALLAFLVVGIFTFLITRDYWQVQTYRQQLEEEKKFSESILKSREQLIAAVSHDLRSPLNTISGYSELMENSSLSDQQMEYLNKVKSATHYVNQLVNDLLDYSKLEAGQLKIETIPFVLCDVLEETARNLQQLHLKKPIVLSLMIASELKQPLLGDPFRIRQVLTNLISNAYKFTKEGFLKISAEITTSEDDDLWVRICVEDSGIGIAEDKQEAIFKEFTQADTSTEKEYGGYGLGLTISKKLASLLQGNLSLKSALGKGSKFIFELPLQRAKTAPSSKVKWVPKIKNNLSILILDDDRAMLGMLKELCENLHLKVAIFSSFDEILVEEELDYDIFLTDIQMPTISGFEVLQQLKSGVVSHYNKQPILAMTGRKDLENDQYTEAGFSAVLQKPFSKTTFMEQLYHLFPEKLERVQKEEDSNLVKGGTSLYNLVVLASFLGEQSKGFQEVIEIFMTDTKRNTTLLEKAFTTENSSELNAIAHRMLPMFRQLEANKVIPFLEKLEVLKKTEATKKELEELQTNTFHTISELITALKKDTLIVPAYKN